MVPFLNRILKQKAFVAIVEGNPLDSKEYNVWLILFCFSGS